MPYIGKIESAVDWPDGLVVPLPAPGAVVTLEYKKFYDTPPLVASQHRRQGPKVGRNAPCPCGSSKKYKKCCLNSIV